MVRLNSGQNMLSAWYTEEKGDISGTDGRMEMVLAPKWSTKNADSDEMNIQGFILRSGGDLPPKYKKKLHF